jgi:hypothetical protein
MPASSTRSKRYVIQSIRSEIEQQAEEAKAKLAVMEAEAATRRNIELQKKREERIKYKIFHSEYGRRILENAVAGETGCLMFDHTPKVLDIASELSDRGFSVDHEGEYELDHLKDEWRNQFKDIFLTTEQKVAKLMPLETTNLRQRLLTSANEIRRTLDNQSRLTTPHPDCQELKDKLLEDSTLEQLALPNLVRLFFEISEMTMYMGDKTIDKANTIIQSVLDDIAEYEDDERVINLYYIDWSYPKESDTTDCVNARFTDWLSDKYGQMLVKTIFSEIEKKDINGENTAEFLFHKGYASNEYVGGELVRAMLMFSEIEIPFKRSHITDLFKTLGYNAEFTKDSAEKRFLLRLTWDLDSKDKLI